MSSDKQARMSKTRLIGAVPRKSTKRVQTNGQDTAYKPNAWHLFLGVDWGGGEMVETLVVRTTAVQQQ